MSNPGSRAARKRGATELDFTSPKAGCDGGRPATPVVAVEASENSKTLSLVAEDTAAADATCGHCHAQNRATAPASSKEKQGAADDLKPSKKRAAPEGANTNKAAKKKTGLETGTHACQVQGWEKNNAGAKV